MIGAGTADLFGFGPGGAGRKILRVRGYVPFRLLFCGIKFGPAAGFTGTAFIFIIIIRSVITDVGHMKHFLSVLLCGRFIHPIQHAGRTIKPKAQEKISRACFHFVCVCF